MLVTPTVPLALTTTRQNENKFSVLIVDDEEQNRQLLRDLLEAAGYETPEAEDGEQALRIIEAAPPDLVLLDVMMPGMDGFEVCQQLKKDPRTATIPILMVTALTERQERLLGLAAGANDFVAKPVDVQDLSLRVKNALYTKGLYDQLEAERARSEQLLASILPGSIIERMKQGETTIADHHGEATVLVADLVGFTTLLSQVRPTEVVFLLNEIFSAFDQQVERLGLEKIKTIGDAYMVAGGLNSTAPNYTWAIAELALRMHREVNLLNELYGTSIHIRIGISTGELLSGVIGRAKLAYDIWGSAVNLACHLETVGQPGSILVDSETYQKLYHACRFSPSQTVELKNGTTALVHELLIGNFAENPAGSGPGFGIIGTCLSAH